MGRLTPPGQLVSPRQRATTTARYPVQHLRPPQTEETQQVVTNKPLPTDWTDLSVSKAAELLGYGYRESPGRAGQRRVGDLSNILLYLRTQGFDPVELLTFYKDEGGSRSEGETGYIAYKLLGGDKPPTPV